MHELSDIAVVASPLKLFENKALVVCNRNGLPAKFLSIGILKC
jgi:hypothetical protein